MNVKLSNDEELLNSQKFTTNLVLGWIKSDFSLTNKRIIGVRPNTLLGVFPLGRNEISYPLKNIASVGVSTKFHLGKFIFGLLFLYFGAGMGEFNVILLAISLFLLLNSFTSKLVVTNSAGQPVHIELSILEKSKVENFVESVNAGISRLN